MEEEKNPSPEYIKGFNVGYLMSKHEPELLAQLPSTDKTSTEYLIALQAGKRQQELEQFKEQLRQTNRPKEKER